VWNELRARCASFASWQTGLAVAALGTIVIAALVICLTSPPFVGLWVTRSGEARMTFGRWRTGEIEVPGVVRTSSRWRNIGSQITLQLPNGEEEHAEWWITGDGTTLNVGREVLYGSSSTPQTK